MDTVVLVGCSIEATAAYSKITDRSAIVYSSLTERIIMNKVQANAINLTTNEALVLQQVYENGGDDAATLAAQMGIPRRTAMHVLADLRRKGLMVIDQAYDDAWVRLTTRGKRLVQRIWPEAQAIVY